jgi:hypothetical protein
MSIFRLQFKRNLANIQSLLEGEVLFGLHPILITLEQNRRSFHHIFIKNTIPRDEGILGRIVRLAEARHIEIVPLPGKILNLLSKGALHQVRGSWAITAHTI